MVPFFKKILTHLFATQEFDHNNQAPIMLNNALLSSHV